MAELIITEKSKLVNIANAIRTKTGTTDTFTLSEMPSMVTGISGGVTLPELNNEGVAAELLSGKQLIDEDGNIVTGSMPNNGAISSTMDGINTKSITIPVGYTSGGTVSLDNTIDNEVDEQADLIAQIRSVVDGLPEASSEPNLQDKTVTPSKSAQTITADSGYDALSKVTVNAIPSTYVQPTASKGATTYTPSTTNQTIAAGTYLTGVQTIKGDSNLVAGNIKSGVSIFGVNGTLTEGGGASADYSVEDGLITGATKIYSNNRATSIAQYTFYSNSFLTSVNFAAATSIGSYAFAYCKTLQYADFLACKTIDTYAFSMCSQLKTINLPEATTISGNAFRNCNSLTTINVPKVTFIAANAFQYCSKLGVLNLPNVSQINGYAFGYCYTLSSLTLGASSVCTLSASTAFTSTPYAGYSKSFSGTPYIYVPSSLVASYKAATNWTYFSSYFSGI